MSVNKNSINLQDSFLNQARKENVPVAIHLVNGFQIKGNVAGFDNFTVVVEYMGKQQLVYKHAISTVTPMRALGNLFGEKSKNADGTRTEAGENK